MQKTIQMEINALNYKIKNSEHILYNEMKTIFYNSRTGRYLKLVNNNRSFGIWIGKKFLPLSKVEHQKEIDNSNMSDDCRHLLSQF